MSLRHPVVTLFFMYICKYMDSTHILRMSFLCMCVCMCICICMYVLCISIFMCKYVFLIRVFFGHILLLNVYGVAMISRLLKIVGLFCKRAL